MLTHFYCLCTLWQRLVEELTPEYAECAANSSYAYWLYQSEKDVCQLNESDDELRMRFAMKEARRHYIGEDMNFDNALGKLKKAMGFRIEKRVDLMRQIGDASALQDESYDEHEREILQRYRGYVEEELSKQLFFTGGYDRQNRSLAIRGERSDAQHDPEGYMVTMVYSIERALAATEILSRGQEEKTHAWLDMGRYDSQHSPGSGVYRHVALLLQRYYPERLQTFALFDPPFWVRALHKIVSPFLSPVTRKKVLLISGSQREKTLKELVDVENALPALQEDGTLVSDVDIQKYICEVPFHGVYGLKNDNQQEN
jgi:CRAL/TRIO domain